MSGLGSKTTIHGKNGPQRGSLLLGALFWALNAGSLGFDFPVFLGAAPQCGFPSRALFDLCVGHAGWLQVPRTEAGSGLIPCGARRYTPTPKRGLPGDSRESMAVWLRWKFRASRATIFIHQTRLHTNCFSSGLSVALWCWGLFLSPAFLGGSRTPDPRVGGLPPPPNPPHLQ